MVKVTSLTTGLDELRGFFKLKERLIEASGSLPAYNAGPSSIVKGKMRAQAAGLSSIIRAGRESETLRSIIANARYFFSRSPPRRATEDSGVASRVENIQNQMTFFALSPRFESAVYR